MVEVYHSLKIKRDTLKILEDVKEAYCSKHDISTLSNDEIIRKALNSLNANLKASFWD